MEYFCVCVYSEGGLANGAAKPSPLIFFTLN